jgi:hypothetical protein
MTRLQLCAQQGVPRLALWIVLCLTFGIGAVGQVPIPQLASYRPVWPSELPTGSPDTTLQISGSGFTQDSVIQVNGQDIPTDHITASRIGGTELLLRAMIPQSWLRVPRSLEIRVLNPYGGASLPIEVQVKSRRQPAKMEIEFSQTTVGQKDQLEVTVHVANQGNVGFLLPKKIAPFIGGNMLDSSYHFETKRPNDVTFANTGIANLDGEWSKNPTEDQLLQSGQAVLVAPGETYSDEVRFLVDNLRRVGNQPPLLPGQYVVRMRFDPRFVPGADEFRIKFLSEPLLSNSVVLTVLRQ